MVIILCEWHVYLTQPIPWLLMSWRRKEPGHWQPWYWYVFSRNITVSAYWRIDTSRNISVSTLMNQYQKWVSVTSFDFSTLEWRHNGRDSVSNHQPDDCLFNRLFRRRSKKTSKLRVAGLCAGNSPGTGEFPAQMASNAETVSIWWRHHGCVRCAFCIWVATTVNIQRPGALNASRESAIYGPLILNDWPTNTITCTNNKLPTEIRWFIMHDYCP